MMTAFCSSSLQIVVLIFCILFIDIKSTRGAAPVDVELAFSDFDFDPRADSVPSEEQMERVKVFDEMVVLAAQLNSESKFDEADVAFRNAIEGLEDILGPDHKMTLTAVNHFAVAYTIRPPDANGDLSGYKNAVPLLERSLKGFEASLGPEDSATMTTMTMLSLVLKRLKRNKEAKPYYERIFKLKQATLGRSNIETLTAESELASIYLSLGHWEEAKEHYEKSYQSMTLLIGSEHKDTLTSQFYFALASSQLGQLQEALANLKVVVRVGTAVFGDEHAIIKKAVRFVEILKQKINTDEDDL